MGPSVYVRSQEEWCRLCLWSVVLGGRAEDDIILQGMVWDSHAEAGAVQAWSLPPCGSHRAVWPGLGKRC